MRKLIVRLLTPLSAITLMLLASVFFTGSISANDENVSVEWVTNLFPKINHCTPKDWYSAQNITAHLLEKKGYRPYEVADSSAKYKIREKFYGIDATELSIPSGEDSIYTVTVSASTEKLAKRIKQITGINISVYNGDAYVAKSGKAYLVPISKNQSMFVCFTYDGGF